MGPSMNYLAGSEKTLEYWQWRDTPYFRKRQDGSLATRYGLVSYQDTRWRRVLHSLQRDTWRILLPQQTEQKHLSLQVFMLINKNVKLVTIVEGDQKAPFSIRPPLHRGVGEDATPFPGLLHFTLDTYLILLRYQVPFLKSLVWRDLGLNPGLPDHWRTLYPLGQWAGLLLNM